jgi:hypothetical protein
MAPHPEVAEQVAHSGGKSTSPAAVLYHTFLKFTFLVYDHAMNNCVSYNNTPSFPPDNVACNRYTHPHTESHYQCVSAIGI